MTPLSAVEAGNGITPVTKDGLGRDLEADERHRILAVDDDETILSLMVDTLSSQQYQVDVARTCEDALPLILFRDYCSIILDIVLPDANGMSLFRQIARRRPALRPRVIFVTGAMDQGEARRFVKLIDNRVLLKPFRLGELITAVRQVDSLNIG